MREWVSVQQAAKSSGLCDETIRRYIYAGRIKDAVRLPKEWRVPADWMESFGKEEGDADVQEGGDVPAHD